VQPKAAKGRNKLSSREQERRARQSAHAHINGAADRERRWVTGPTLRKRLGISAMTLWRWRRAGGFPVPKVINGRLYFAADQIEAWIAAQPDAA
jgi:predicted DNA-binding transcriptional regulator AlpA